MATNKRLIKSNDGGVAVPASFNTATYTGNGTTNPITGVGFQPDFTWIKIRDGASSHVLIDSTRGVQKYLNSNTTSQEATSTDQFTSFDTDGFTLGSNAGAGGNTNQNGNNYVAWCWKAGGAAVTNTDGTITSQVSANVDAGFSIVSYTGNLIAGATVGHGLGVEPDMIIVKERSQGTGGWLVYHSALGTAANVLYLNGTAPEQIGVNTFNGTNPTDSVFSLGYNGEVNDNGQTNIAYCFAEVAGFSKFGSYVGTGASGNTIVTGFEPAFVMIKNATTGSTAWNMVDNKRNTGTTFDNFLQANTSIAEAQTEICSITSNGFTVSGNVSFNNSSGDTFIYMAFANQF